MYDNDALTWSPKGRIFQIEYAMEAVKQGSACVGVRSKTHSVLVALRRASSELATHQPKIFEIDEHLGMAISGLTADARVLCKYMRSEAMNYRFVYASDQPVGRLVQQVADKSQVHTQRYGRRPYGVGLLVIGYDQAGPHLFETSPSGNYYEYTAISIGARSQSSRTYLEKHAYLFNDLPVDELIKHALLALREAVESKESLNVKNCVIGVVGENHPFTIVREDELRAYLVAIEQETPEPMAQ